MKAESPPQPQRIPYKFIPMPHDAFERLGDPDHVALLFLILGLIREGDGTFQATNAELSARLGRCREILQVGLNAIEAAGYVARVKDGGRWFVLGPACAPPGADQAAPPGEASAVDAPPGRPVRAARQPSWRRQAALMAPPGRRHEGRKSKADKAHRDAPLFRESLREEEGEGKFKTREAPMGRGSEIPAPRPGPAPAPSSETEADRMEALRKHWGTLDPAERQEIIAGVAAEQPGIQRFKQAFESHCLKALETHPRHRDLYPPLAMPPPAIGPPAPRKHEPADDPLDYVRRTCGFQTADGLDLADFMGEKLKKGGSVLRYRQILALAEVNPADAAAVGRFFREALDQKHSPPGVYFDIALAGRWPAKQKPAGGPTSNVPPGRLGETLPTQQTYTASR